MLRLSRFAAYGMAALMPVLGFAQQATQTTLSAETHDMNGRTRATLSVAVLGEDGQPATGPVVIKDGARQLAGAALDAQGKAQISVDLLAGGHSLRAVFAGDTAHQASASAVSEVTAQASSTPDFQVSVNPASISLTQGQSGTVTASVMPLNANALTASMFVTLSCSGFPDQSSCTFTPENVEILPNATAAIPSKMVITTAAGTGSVEMVRPRIRPGDRPVNWAVLLPGALGFAGLAFSVRRRRWMQRLSLIALVGLVTMLGATACSPRYDYYHHGPTHNLPTPAGSYTLTVTAQSSNGITATTHSTPFALTVNTLK